MRVCVVGAGSIGGFVAARLAAAGVEVTLVARGATLRALQSSGLRVIEDGVTNTFRLRAAASPREAGPHDLVVLATKAHQVGAIADELPHAWHRESTLLTMQNGIPWWYFQSLPGPHGGRHVESVDPGGAIARAIAPERIVGCVVYPACEVLAPGLIRHVEGLRLPVGELDGSLSARASSIGALLESAGFKAPVLRDVRSEIWLKLWGNLCFNPMSALTRASLAAICRDPATRALALAMMEEARTVAEALGSSFRVSAERRVEGAERVGEHRTSMLQDVEAGRPTEVQALLGAVIELAHVVGAPVPRLEAVYACTRLLESVAVAANAVQPERSAA
jgi:2-dehydropantoate 2-reductase